MGTGQTRSGGGPSRAQARSCRERKKFDLDQDVQVGVVGLNYGNDLIHVTEVSHHGAIIEYLSVLSQCSHTDTVREHLEVWDGVGYPGKIWGKDGIGVEIQPLLPRGCSGAGYSVADFVPLRLSRSAEMILFFMAVGTRQSRQECRCVK